MSQGILQMLKNFSKQPGCERYRMDAERVKLLTDYLWCRQLTPALTFEVFMACFTPLADFDEKNRKHPADALHYRCPRAKKQAEQQGMPQWDAEECVDFTALYVDMIREAEAQGTEVPLTYDQFLERLGPAYKSGELTPPPAPAEERPKRAKKAQADTIPAPAGEAPAQASAPATQLSCEQRCMYTIGGASGSRQVRGKITGHFMENGRHYADFKADSGEVFPAINWDHLTPLSEEEHPLPKGPDPRSVKEHQKLWLPKAQTQQVLNALALNQPMGNVNVGDPIYPFAQGYSDGKTATVTVVNGETGPYVDAQLVNSETDEVLADEPPRKSIVGTYTFTTDAGVYTLEVCIRE